MLEIPCLALEEVEIGLSLQQFLDLFAIEFPVRLGARTTDGGPLAAVEKTELDAGVISCNTHYSIHRVNLAHEVPLTEPADSRIAGHHPDRVDAVGE